VRQIRLDKPVVPTSLTTQVRALVISQHDAVRHQLVEYLSRSQALAVRGERFSAEAIIAAGPDVLILDLSRLGADGLSQAIAAARQVGAGLIALASIRDAADEQAVLDVGGRYCLKSAGAGGLAETVREMARQST